MVTAILCAVVFLASALIDFAHARGIVAIGERAGHRAARWSLAQWIGSTIGFLIAMKVTCWVLPFEAAGLYVGTVLAVRRTRPPRTLAEHLSQPVDLEPVLAALSRSSAGLRA